MKCSRKTQPAFLHNQNKKLKKMFLILDDTHGRTELKGKSFIFISVLILL